MASIDSILYYNNETEALYFEKDLIFKRDYEIEKNNQLLVFLLYLGAFYHLGWYIVSMNQSFSYQDLIRILDECKLIFRLINENYDMFDKENIESMNTTKLLNNLLDYLDESRVTDSDSDEDDVASNLSEEESDEESDEKSDEESEEEEEESEEEDEYDISYECEYDCGFENDEKNVVEDHEKSCMNKYDESEIEAAEILTSMGKDWIFNN